MQKKNKKLRIALAGWNGVADDLENELKNRGHEVVKILRSDAELRKLDVLITWNEIHQYGNSDLIEKANKFGVKTILLQHGRRGTSRIYPPFNEQLVCKHACLWGENDRKRLIECGAPPERLHVTGTSIFRHLKPREKHEGINVVYCPEHWGEEVVENNIIAGVLRKIPGIKVITKVLAGEHIMPQYDNIVVSDRNTPEHFEIVADVLKTADVVVGVSESTFELMAEMLDIPVVIADIWIPKPNMGDIRYIDYHREYSNACTRVKDVRKLGEAIKYAVKHQEHLREERKQISILDGGINIEDPVGNLIKVIEND